MGLRDKIKDKLHKDEPSQDYENPQAPGAFPADTNTGYKQEQQQPITGKEQRTSSHRYTDSGVDFDDDQRHSPSQGQQPYWGDVNKQQRHVGRTSPPRTSDDVRRKDLPLRPSEQQQAVSPTSSVGGTYNTVSGAGSREYESQQQYGDRRTGYGDRASYEQDRGYSGVPARSSRDYDNTTHQAGGGVPRSSLIDPYQTNHNTTSTTQTRAGPHDTNMANKMDPRVDSDRDGSGMGAGVGYSSVPRGQQQQQQYGGVQQQPGFMGAQQQQPQMSGPMAGVAGAAASSGMGPDHYGPGHGGAKVMHRCVGCGMDNDISHYFRKDAVYRMG